MNRADKASGAALTAATERGSVTRAIRLLEAIGYEPLPKQREISERKHSLGNVILENILADQLSCLNSIDARSDVVPFSSDNIASAIQRLKSQAPGGLLRTNQIATELLLFGTALEQTIGEETRSYQLRYIDWETWSNNVFHVCSEFNVERSRSSSTETVDLVLFVNGIPLVVIECAAAGTNISDAIYQSLFYQGEAEIPQLYFTAQLLLASTLKSTRYGTVGTLAEDWLKWREPGLRYEELDRYLGTSAESIERSLGQAKGKDVHSPAKERSEQAATEQDRVLYAMCRPQRLLEIARRFTISYRDIKLIGRYHQVHTIEKLLQRLKTRDANGRRRGGVIWQTAGTGKSLTMVFAARAIAQEFQSEHPRIVVVSDRVELDEQFREIFTGSGLAPQQARSGRHLRDLLSHTDAPLITTVINKFDTALRARDDDAEQPSGETFILVDETQRCQYDTLHESMRRVFPNATYIGFTGTPLYKSEKDTFEAFGGLIDSYTVKQAMADHVLVPIAYEERRISGAKTVDQNDDVLRQAAPLSEGLIGREIGALNPDDTHETIRRVAADISSHFKSHWSGSGFKGLVIVPSRRAAVRYKLAFDALGEVTAEAVISATPGDDFHGTSDPEVKRFWQSIIAKYGNEREYTSTIIDQFRRKEHPELLIVLNRLLSGLDAPTNSVLYLTTKVEGHQLLQAISLINRRNTRKDMGYIVDYGSGLGALNNALTSFQLLEQYDKADVAGALQPLTSKTHHPPRHQPGRTHSADGEPSSSSTPGAREQPTNVREEQAAKAIYRIIEKAVPPAGPDKGRRKALAKIAGRMLDVFKRHVVVNWANNEDVQNAMVNDLDDVLFEEVKRENGLHMSIEHIDNILGKVMDIAHEYLSERQASA